LRVEGVGFEGVFRFRVCVEGIGFRFFRAQTTFQTIKSVFYFEWSEVKESGWRALLEKQGLHRAAEILEKYGMGLALPPKCPTLKDDFSELEASCRYIKFWVRRGAAMRHEKSKPYKQPTSV